MHRKIAAHSNMHRKIPRTCNAPLDAIYTVYSVLERWSLCSISFRTGVYVCSIVYTVFIYVHNLHRKILCTICIARYMQECCAHGYASQDIYRTHTMLRWTRYILCIVCLNLDLFAAFLFAQVLLVLLFLPLFRCHHGVHQPASEFEGQPASRQPAREFGGQPASRQPAREFGGQRASQQPTREIGGQPVSRQPASHSAASQPATQFGGQPTPTKPRVGKPRATPRGNQGRADSKKVFEGYNAYPFGTARRVHSEP